MSMNEFRRLAANQRRSISRYGSFPPKRERGTGRHQSHAGARAHLNNNRPEAYLLSADYYEQLLARMDDLEDAHLVREHAAGPFVEVKLDDL
jgi:hypothetical protein